MKEDLSEIRKLSGSDKVPFLSCSNLVTQDLRSKFSCFPRHGVADKSG